MPHSDTQLTDALFDVVSAIPAAKRPRVKAQIERLQALVGSTDDLFIDRRRVAWSKDGKARRAVEMRAKVAKAEAVKYVLSYTDGREIDCTLGEAAEVVGKRSSTLSVYISHGKGRYSCVVDDEVVTVSRK